MSERRTKERRTSSELGCQTAHPVALWPESLPAEESKGFDFTDLDEPGASVWWQWLKR